MRSFKLKVYWTMRYIEDEFDGKRSTPSEIAETLVEVFKVPASAKSVYDVLKKSRDVHKDSKGYKLMKSGLDELSASDEGEKDESVFIEANKPFAGKSISKKIFIGMTGTVMICDPYFDSATLDFLYRNFSKKVEIRLLTQKIKDVPSGSLSSQIKELRKEGYHLEVRIYSSSDLHDRYVIDTKDLWLSGNSFNSLGNKESFITRIGSDIRESVLATFNIRWKSSTPIS